MLRPSDKSRGPGPLSERGWTWLAVAAVAAAGASLIVGGGLGRWLAAALLLAVAPRLLAPIRAHPRVRAFWERRGPAILRWTPLALVATLTLALLGELALGRPPITRDHGIHYFQTQVLVEELIPRGQLIGLSTRLNTGYPFGDSYPVLGYLFTGAANLVSFGAISLRTSYAWGLLAVWVIGLWGVWRLAQTIASELVDREDEGTVGVGGAPGEAGDAGDAGEADRADGADQAGAVDGARPSRPQPGEADPRPTLLDPRWAGALAALAWLIDPGASREGGWNYLMFHGVWPQMLSSALWVASLPATYAALRKPSARRLAFASLLLGGSVLAHPFGMLTAAASAAAWPVVTWASGAMRSKLPPGVIRWWLLIHALAVLVSIGWVYVFFASAGSMSRSPVPWQPLGALVTQLFAGELFTNHRAWIGPLAVIGLLVAVRRGRAMAWMGVVLVCGLLVLGSEAAITVLRLDLLVSGFKNLQFPRYAIALKPVLYAFSGVGGAVLLARLRSVPERDHPAEPASGSPAARDRPLARPAYLRPRAARLLACICLAPLIVGLIDDRGRLLPHPVQGLQTFQGSSHGEVDQALLDALEAERAAAGEGPFKVAFLRRGMGGGTFPLFAITDAGAELVLDGHIPAVNYKYQVRRRTPEALRYAGVTHVIHDGPLDRGTEDPQLLAALEVVGEFGIWTLARLPANDRLRPLGFETARGLDRDAVSVERPEPDRVQLTVAATDKGGRVDLAIGPYRKWRAREAGGAFIELDEARLSGGVPGIAVPIPAGGEQSIELRYTKPRTERSLGWLSVVTILLLSIALAWDREFHLAERLHAPRVIAISWGLGLATVAVAVAWGVREQHRQLEVTWAELIETHKGSPRLARGRDIAFSRDLVISRAWTVTRSTLDGCDGTLGKDAMAGCTQEDAEPRISMAYRKPYLYRCLHFAVPARGNATILLDDVAEDEDVAGFFVPGTRQVDGLELWLPHEKDFRAPTKRHKRQHFHAPAESLRRDDEGRVAIDMRNSSNRSIPICWALASAGPP